MSVTIIVIYMMSMMIIVIYMMSVMNIMIYMIFLRFLGIFKREKQKNKLQWSLRQSDQNQQQKQCLCRAFIETHDKGAIYCRAFCSPAHGKKRSLPCILFPGTRQRGLFAMRFLPRRTAKISSLPCVLLPDARQRVSHAI
jgi:hypothetical protein